MTTATQLQVWQNGTVTGGPNGDGRYPLIYADGLVYLVYCPAAQALDPSLVESPLNIHVAAASASAQQAAASATAANQSSVTAGTHKDSAAVSATNALASKNAAAASAINIETNATNTAANAAVAQISATNAAGSAIAANNSAVNAETSKTGADTAKVASQTAQTASETARTLAQDWSNKAVNIEVTPGLFSAYHWSQKAQVNAIGALKYQGSWSAVTALPPNPVLGDFYKVSVAGAGYDIGDQIVYNGTSWDKIDNTELVLSVAGRIGNVTISQTDVGLPLVNNTSDATKNAAIATLSNKVVDGGDFL